MTSDQTKVLMRVISGRLERPTHTHTDILIANVLVERDAMLSAMKMAVAEGTKVADIKDCLRLVIEKVEAEV
jgi:hypothetical protein